MAARASRPKFTCLVALCAALPFAAHAGDKCSKPPYGASPGEYDVYRETLGSVVPATHILPGICRAKFQGGSRDALHKLGITDDEIDRLSVGQLAVQVIGAIRAKMQDEQPQADGIYEAFTCTKVTGRCYAPPGAFKSSSRAECEHYIQTVGFADPTKSVYMHCFFRANPWQP